MIGEKFPGGWAAFLGEAPNRTLFRDGDIGCIGFMHPDDVGVDSLGRKAMDDINEYVLSFRPESNY